MIQIAQDISSSVQAKKRRRSGLRFLACAIGEIDKSRCVTYFSTVPKAGKQTGLDWNIKNHPSREG